MYKNFITHDTRGTGEARHVHKVKVGCGWSLCEFLISTRHLFWVRTVQGAFVRGSQRAEVELKIIRAAARRAEAWISFTFYNVGRRREPPDPPSIGAQNSSINVPHRSSLRGEIALITFSSSDRGPSRSAIFSSGTTSLSEPSDVTAWVDSQFGSVHNSRIPTDAPTLSPTRGTGLMLVLHDMI